VVQEVGIGTFGRVLECQDLQSRRCDRSDRVAIKVIRKVPRYYDSAVIEARIIQDINRRGGRGLSHFVVLYDDFSFDGHYSLVFECLGPSLYDFLRKHSYRPFPMTCIHDFVVQLLEALEFIHAFRLCHTDLKIENVLLVSGREVLYRNRPVPASTRIKIIDFGGAAYDADKKARVINTRQYRAPEVVLDTVWSMPSDMWSLGCIFVELFQGDLLFPTHDDVEHLALMEKVISPFPEWMLRTSASRNPSRDSLVRRAFNSRNWHRLESVLSRESVSFVRNARTLESIVRDPEDSWFLSLLRRILVIDPQDRATAHEALKFLRRVGRDGVRRA
jgi:serine/threonine protein kinase